MSKTSRSAIPEPGWQLEAQLWSCGCTPVAGVDEAGRGALAGPVVAAAVVLPCGSYPFRDSKTLTPRARERLARQVEEVALGWAIGVAEATEIDEHNVLQATRTAAVRAIAQLPMPVAGLVTDYLQLPLELPQVAVPRADATSFQVAAASLLAKTYRDRLMRRYHLRFPDYGFDRNKGYGSRDHLAALTRCGPCPIHRRTFRPVAQGRLFER